MIAGDHGTGGNPPPPTYGGTIKELSLLTWNIGNPSADRAQRQLEWLAKRPEPVLVLTETKASAGCQMLADAFLAAGYDVVCPSLGPGELSTMILSRVTLGPDDWASRLRYTLCVNPRLEKALVRGVIHSRR